MRVHGSALTMDVSLDFCRTLRQGGDEVSKWSVRSDRPEMGESEIFTVVNVYEDGHESSRIGESGLYRVVFILGQRFHSVSDVNISFDVTGQGDSFLQLWNPKIRNQEQIFGVVVDATNPDGSASKCEIRTNNLGRISQLCFPEIFGEHFQHAETIAYGFVQPMLSWLSYQYDIPFEVSQIHCYEVATSCERVTTYLSPGVKCLSNDKPFLPTMMAPPLMECIGQYHAAMKTTDEFYRLFCLFRSAEGLRHIRTKLDDLARERKIFPLKARSPRRRVPADLAIEQHYPKLVNKSLTKARDYLWEEIRSHLAHLDFDSGKFLSLHSYGEVTRVQRIIPILRYIVKNLIVEEIAAHDEIRSRLGLTTEFLTWDEKASEE